MPADLKALRKRVASIKSTQQITKAMKMVASAKLRRAQEAAEQARPYAQRLGALVGVLASGESEVVHPLLAPRDEHSVHVVLVTSDRGLCGGYNTNLGRKAQAFLAEHEGTATTFTVFGRKAADYFRRRKIPVEEQLAGPVALPIIETAQELAERLTARVLEGRCDAVYLIYSQFRSMISQVPTVERLIPVAVPEAEAGAGADSMARDYLYEPNAGSVLGDIAPRYVKTLVGRALLEAAASEHSARMTAMDNASRNASELIDRLTLAMNRARQAAITNDLMEVVAGAEALKG
jgi:F-type H+-transporting ATPase subunit gamma